MDGRKRRYVPIDVYVAFGSTGTKLLKKLGNEGLLIWMLFLAACKREQQQGTFTYASEEEGWGKLGATASAFTLQDFFRETGKLKATKRERSGRVSFVRCLSWASWNGDWKRQRDAESVADKRETSTSIASHHISSSSIPLHRKSSSSIPDKTPAPTKVQSRQEATEYEYESDTDNEHESEGDLGPLVKEVFKYWQQQRSHPNAKLGATRKHKIHARLEEKFTVEQLKRAVDGVARDPWEERRLHDDIVQIFRDASQVEKFIALSDGLADPATPWKREWET